ncbi:hypothetical protein [Embleya hyalina]|uniref:Uncharacterized protein n=1 Tax=Embleya hyalina TaxID=516124 RepID=A0A401YWV1_9ACTN|nr:hypothetical protein [Embleya hyalina]GCD99097.1 hypothetical protein EHYA_06809 [Embleya hyalina]
MTSRLPPAPTDQYVCPPDARPVTTRALLTVRENPADTIAARAMTCIHGGAGFGRTVAVTGCLRELEPDQGIHRITFHARPTTRAVRHELFTGLGLPGRPPRYASEFDHLLKPSSPPTPAPSSSTKHSGSPATVWDAWFLHGWRVVCCGVSLECSARLSTFGWRLNARSRRPGEGGSPPTGRTFTAVAVRRARPDWYQVVSCRIWRRPR